MSETDTSNARAVAFERWANMFTAHKAFSHPSELHGVLCGRLAAGARINEEEWLAMVCEHMGLPQTATDESDELREFMASAYSQTLELLKATDMSFQPLLPDDDYAIEQRLEASPLGCVGSSRAWRCPLVRHWVRRRTRFANSLKIWWRSVRWPMMTSRTMKANNN